MALQPHRRRFTLAEYHQMAQAGILSEDDRVELLDGEIVEMTPIGREHAACVSRLTELFVRTFGDVAIVSVRNPIRLVGDTEPQPDLALLHRQPDFYRAALPGPGDIFLLVEVADTTEAFDRRIKVPLYSRNAIPESWLIDLSRERITVYRDSKPNGYQTRQVLRRGERVAPDAFPKRELTVEAMLGEAE